MLRNIFDMLWNFDINQMEATIRPKIWNNIDPLLWLFDCVIAKRSKSVFNFVLSSFGTLFISGWARSSSPPVTMGEAMLWITIGVEVEDSGKKISFRFLAGLSLAYKMLSILHDICAIFTAYYGPEVFRAEDTPLKKWACGKLSFENRRQNFLYFGYFSGFWLRLQILVLRQSYY